MDSSSENTYTDAISYKLALEEHHLAPNYDNEQLIYRMRAQNYMCDDDADDTTKVGDNRLEKIE